MTKNRKTVRKGFTYLQCDDFADYLSKMAAQGWHFKEWGAGLVFEKGEPEETVYAVEVFIHGSQYDLKPDDHTLNFSDYCEAAGWKLIDSKQKYCIFTQIRPDAEPIVTAEERLKNASKAYRGQLIWQIVLSLMWIGNMLLRFLPESQLINSLFSDFQLLTCAFWVYYALCTAVKCIWYVSWLCKAKKRCAAGETKILNQAKETLLNWASNCILIVFLVLQTGVGGPVILTVVLITIAVLLIFSLLMAKFRPDRDTYFGISLVLPIVLIMVIIFVAFFSMAISDEEEPSLDQFPLVYEDFGYNAGNTASTYSTSSSSMFGSKRYYSVHYKDASIAYEIYETEQDWILDLVWEHHMGTESTISGSVVECAALWSAEAAFHNGKNYIVRYQDTILIFRFLEFDLTEEHVAIIRDALGLEG